MAELGIVCGTTWYDSTEAMPSTSLFPIACPAALAGSTASKAALTGAKIVMPSAASSWSARPGTAEMAPRRVLRSGSACRAATKSWALAWAASARTVTAERYLMLLWEGSYKT